MKQIRKITLAMIFAIVLSVTVPVTTPVFHNVAYADAATVQINKNKQSLYINETTQLHILGTNKTVLWSSSDKTIAKVSSKGKVTAVSEGTAKITGKVGTKRYTCSITVKAKELTSAQVYSKASKATVEIVAQTSDAYYNLGSGFFIDNGILVTNYHVIKGAYKIEVTTYDETTYTVDQVLGYDPVIDIAILKVNSTNDYLKINQRGVTVGEQIYIIGSPLGLTGTFAGGLVASNSRIIDDIDYIQVTAPMSQGNSGGPLLNVYGEVMGINTWQYVNGQNLNFSINIWEIDNINTESPVSVEEFYSKTLDSNTIYNEGSSGNTSGTITSFPEIAGMKQSNAYLLNNSGISGGSYIIIVPR